MLALFTRARPLRTVWRVRIAGRTSLLAGTAHFFPYHFRRSLRVLVGGAGSVLLEGPLDDAAMARVVASGTAGGGRTLAEALDTATVLKVNAEFGAPAPAFAAHPLYHEIFGSDPASQLCVPIQGLKPWMAFFRIWTHYLRQHGWTYRLDLDALRAASGLGWPVQVLETIDEQIAALEGLPLARILEFLARVD
ncbi:MAG: TraB/GumN family protein, partial [Burkholderiales bacterium]